MAIGEIFKRKNSEKTLKVQNLSSSHFPKMSSRLHGSLCRADSGPWLWVSNSGLLNLSLGMCTSAVWCERSTSFCRRLSYTRTTYRLRLIKNVWILPVEPELGIFHVIVFPRGQEDYVHVPSGQETGPDAVMQQFRASGLWGFPVWSARRRPSRRLHCPAEVVDAHSRDSEVWSGATGMNHLLLGFCMALLITLQHVWAWRSWCQMP